mmetsp:Transcript_38470/g.96799  ORF Transcript_38470/g.96799 Transcript_38470/m.96799 type:complete len:252 (-) Transcript_38470:51-806(-)
MTDAYIGADSRPIVADLVLAGQAEMKDEVFAAISDVRVSALVKRVLTVSYGGEMGFRAAVEQCADFFQDTLYAEENTLLSAFFERLLLKPDHLAVGARELQLALEAGAAGCVYLHHDSPLRVFTFRGAESAERVVFAKTQPILPGYTLHSSCLLVDHLLEKPPANCKVILLECNTPQGAQFRQGFGGAAAELRFALCLETEADSDDDDKEDQEDQEEDDFFGSATTIVSTSSHSTSVAKDEDEDPMDAFDF